MVMLGLHCTISPYFLPMPVIDTVREGDHQSPKKYLASGADNAWIFYKELPLKNKRKGFQMPIICPEEKQDDYLGLDLNRAHFESEPKALRRATGDYVFHYCPLCIMANTKNVN